MNTSTVDARRAEALPSDYPMAATSLKLPDSLKKRLAREADRAERRAEFAEHAAASEREVMASGRSHTLDIAFDYLEARAAGKKIRRPRARSWRAPSRCSPTIPCSDEQQTTGTGN